jgi:carboxyl-terminal processing protease
LRGVVPDIAFPSDADTEPFGEASFDNPLPWTQVKAADYATTGDLQGLIPLLMPMHEARIRNDKDFQDLQEDIVEARLLRKKNQISLNERTRRAEQDAQEAKARAREARKDAGKTTAKTGSGTTKDKDNSLKDDGLQADERNLTNLLAAEKARKDARDVLLGEAVRVVSDEAAIMKTDSRFAVRVPPSSPVRQD